MEELGTVNMVFCQGEFLAAELVYTGLGLTGMLSMDHWSPG